MNLLYVNHYNVHRKDQVHLMRKMNSCADWRMYGFFDVRIIEV